MPEYKLLRCIVCGYVYDERLGDPEHGIEPGTRWEDIPNSWICPECDEGKDAFVMIEI